MQHQMVSLLTQGLCFSSEACQGLRALSASVQTHIPSTQTWGCAQLRNRTAKKGKLLKNWNDLFKRLRFRYTEDKRKKAKKSAVSGKEDKK